MDDLLQDFLTESHENLVMLDRDIVALEQRPTEIALVNGIFRTIHTIKGTCGFIGLPRLEAVAHVAESVLGSVRDGVVPVSPALISDVLAAVDVIKAILAALERTAQEPEGDDGEIVARLERWMVAPGVTPPVPLVPPLPPAPPVPPAPHLTPAAEAPVATVGADRPPSELPLRTTDTSLRVDVALLDRLMNLVGELVLARNQLIPFTAVVDDAMHSAAVQHLNRVTTDLQGAVMKTRMQPVGSAWTKLPRLVRDLAQSSGKQLTLQMHGAETELDRQILQAIQDPLTHMVRNSSDHGIERPDVRLAAGKPAHGTIRLNAFHEGGHVLLEISDDGAGIDVERVRAKAIERGLVKGEAAAALSDHQVLRFIFEPGFSTAERLTNVSGRGVGMDVVRSNIERMGGTVEMSTRVGEGTTMRVKIPLTLAIVSALLVGAGGQTFAIPQIGVVELVRVTDDARARIEEVHGARFFRLRDTLLPIVSLASAVALADGTPPDDRNLVVCQVGETRFGLEVDQVFDTQEIVVKPMGRLVKHLPAYAGCTILGDGRVIMILDTAGVAQLVLRASHQEATQGTAAATADERGLDREAVLIFDAGAEAPQAVPLAHVARLEEVPVSQIEQVGGRFVVQYRDTLLPLVGAHPGMDVRALDPRPVVVFASHGRAMGLAVDAMRDIVEERLTVDAAARRVGTRGVCVIGGRATEVIDPAHYLRLAYPDEPAHAEAAMPSPPRGDATTVHADLEVAA